MPKEQQQIEIDAKNPMGGKLHLELIQGGPFDGMISVMVSSSYNDPEVLVDPHQLLIAARTLAELS